MRATLFLLLLVPAFSPGEIIDRVSVSIGSQVVTDGAIRRAVQMEGFFTGAAPKLDGPSRRETARRLVEQAIIRREIELSRFNPITRAEVESQIAKIMAGLHLDDAMLRGRLAARSLNNDDLFEEARWQLTLFRFIEFRFRPGVQVSEQEVGVYYDGEFASEMKKAGKPRPALDAVRGAILSVLTERKTQAALDQWLDQAVQQVRIRYREEAFQ